MEMMSLNPLFLIDGYKADHRSQYPEGTTLVYSNFTPRTSRVAGVNHMTFFGLQYACMEYFQHRMNKYFFKRNKEAAVLEYKAGMDAYLGPDKIDVSHIGALHDLGYLPIQINAVPEGTNVPMGCPAMVMWNTHKDFAWLTNYLETLTSALLWGPCTSATIAGIFRSTFDVYARETGVDPSIVPFQGHDFSMRGMFMTEAGIASGAGHLLHFTGTDTVPAIKFLECYYEARLDRELVGCSVPATEHSVMSAGGDDNEFDTYKRLLTEVYPDGIVSIVSDTWDFWNVVTVIIPKLKNEIMARGKGKDGLHKFVVRPDSGKPHLILCGNPDAPNGSPERKGLIQCLYETFGGTKNSKGFIDLHPCIGAIYGDSIDMAEQKRILEGLAIRGFSTSCVVLGIGSYTYQYVTRDTFGTVCKATYAEVNGVGRDLFKAPKTGAWKKSHRGLLRVNEDMTCEQSVSWERQGGLMRPVFKDGVLLRKYTLAEVRKHAESQRKLTFGG